MNQTASARKPGVRSENVVVTAGVAMACCGDPGFRGFVHRSLDAFGTGRGPRLFCRFNEGSFPGISLVQSPLGLTTVLLDGEY